MSDEPRVTIRWNDREFTADEQSAIDTMHRIQAALDRLEDDLDAIAPRLGQVMRPRIRAAMTGIVIKERFR